MICRTRVWIWISTSISLWTSWTGPQMQTQIRIGSSTTSCPHLLRRLLLCTAGTYDHPDRPMPGPVIPEHDSVDHPGVGVDASRAHMSPGQSLNLDFTSPNSAGGGSIGWSAGHIVGGAGASTNTGVGEYAGDGTIDPPVLDGGGNFSPGKLGDDSSSPVRGFGNDGGGGARPSRGTDEDNDEEDVMGLLFENTSDDDFMPPSGLGNGEG
ncbi:hypothetical protein EDB89DRAFT_1996292 [Lactarius sanguifluus]|nr:hypothetical protein EDB89DRAFT_1996292 [Lactarius sanguifluus]